MRCIGQGLESLKTFCAVMSLPNPVEQKSYDVTNNKLSRVMKEVAEESMKRAAVEENSSSPDNLLTVSGDGTWKTRGHSSLIGVCTVIGAETGKVLDREVLSSFCKGCDSYKGVKFGIKYNKWQRRSWGGLWETGFYEIRRPISKVVESLKSGSWKF
ncbi:uncharacterized protein TNCV_3184911 [Trichonephila clavipes]|nr:uncharacterized protein TNCV_3184911 [Trichonephila clavipes]